MDVVVLVYIIVGFQNSSGRLCGAVDVVVLVHVILGFRNYGSEGGTHCTTPNCTRIPKILGSERGEGGNCTSTHCTKLKALLGKGGEGRVCTSTHCTQDSKIPKF